MAITILYSSEQTRRAVVKAYAAGSQPIGWILRGQTAGVLWNPAGSPNQLGVVPDVPTVLANIGGDCLQIMGADGLAVVQGLATSTYQGMNSDDYAASQLIGDVKFSTFRTVHGGIYI
jgi:hypothetical protein